MRRAIPAALLAALAACSDAPPQPRAVETEVPEDIRREATAARPAPAAGAEAVGTPMAERVATLGLLNKRNNIAQDITMKPGETRRFGDVIVALKACERTAPWEMPQETGAFVQVWVQQGRGQQGFGRVFSGWLFRESPSLNVVEHPVYDVWVKDCAMRFPGEEAAASSGESGAAAPAAARTAAPRAEPSPAAAPSPSPSPETNDATD